MSVNGYQRDIWTLTSPRDMILWVLEFNVERVIFLQSFSVSVHPDAGRATAKQPRRLQQLCRIQYVYPGRGGGGFLLN